MSRRHGAPTKVGGGPAFGARAVAGGPILRCGHGGQGDGMTNTTQSLTTSHCACDPSSRADGARNRRRWFTVLAVMAAATATWGVLHSALHIDLAVRQGEHVQHVDSLAVTLTSLGRRPRRLAHAHAARAAYRARSARLAAAGDWRPPGLAHRARRCGDALCRARPARPAPRRRPRSARRAARSARPLTPLIAARHSADGGPRAANDQNSGGGHDSGRGRCRRSGTGPREVPR